MNRNLDLIQTSLSPLSSDDNDVDELLLIGKLPSKGEGEEKDYDKAQDESEEEEQEESETIPKKRVKRVVSPNVTIRTSGRSTKLTTRATELVQVKQQATSMKKWSTFEIETTTKYIVECAKFNRGRSWNEFLLRNPSINKNAAQCAGFAFSLVHRGQLGISRSSNHGSNSNNLSSNWGLQVDGEEEVGRKDIISQSKAGRYAGKSGEEWVASIVAGRDCDNPPGSRSEASGSNSNQSSGNFIVRLVPNSNSTSSTLTASSFNSNSTPPMLSSSPATSSIASTSNLNPNCRTVDNLIERPWSIIELKALKSIVEELISIGFEVDFKTVSYELNQHLPDSITVRTEEECEVKWLGFEKVQREREGKLKGKEVENRVNSSSDPHSTSSPSIAPFSNFLTPAKRLNQELIVPEPLIRKNFRSNEAFLEAVKERNNEMDESV